MPPPTPTCMSPARIAWSRITDARSPEAQTLLIVSEETSLGMLRLDLRLARGDLPLAGLQHLAHHDVLDLLGLHAGALERRADRDPAELGGVERGQAAAHLADGGARGAEDHGLGHRNRHSPVDGGKGRETANGSGPLRDRRRESRAPDATRRAASRISCRSHAGLGHHQTRREHRRRHGRGGRVRGRGSPGRGAARSSASCSPRARPAARSRRSRWPTPRASAGCSWGSGARADFTPERARVAAAVACERASEIATRTLCWEAPRDGDAAVAAALVRGHDPARLPLRAPQVGARASGRTRATTLPSASSA